MSDAWLMASTGLTNRSDAQRGIVGTGVQDIATGTEERDVSEVLDLLALADTPFVNKIGWGPECGTRIIEWISEDLNPGYFPLLSQVVSAGPSIIATQLGNVNGSELTRQVHDGTLLYARSSATADTTHSLMVVVSEPGAGPSMLVSQLLVGVMSGIGSAGLIAGNNVYVLGQVANEGSIPGQAKPRPRVLASNEFTIIRKDIAITGSMKSNDMYAIGREDKHQILMRMKEMQRERERMALYSSHSSRTETLAGLMNGALGFLGGQSGTHIDISTTALTETAVNNIVTQIWENGGRNLCMFGDIKQLSKFTRWDKNRIRMKVRDSVGGGHITSYLTESGIELDLEPMANVPTNLAFIIDPSKIELRAKKGRKAVMSKLGLSGDFEDWQIISEFSMEMRGYNLGQHGMFTVLR